MSTQSVRPAPNPKRRISLTSRFQIKWVMLLVAVLIAAGYGLYRHWQGPLVPAYQVLSRPLVQYVVATGRIVSDSRVQVGSEITGVVTERLVREGDRVAAGQLLIRLRADELLARRDEALAALTQLQEVRRPRAEANLAQAEAQLDQARRELERRRILLASKATPREEMERAEQALAVALAAAEQARVDVASLAPGESEEALIQARLDAAQAALSKTEIRAQFSGTILTRNVEAGDLVQPGGVLLEIARDDDIEVLVPVDERNLGLLEIGQQAVCIADAYLTQPFEATVARIAPTVDPQRGTVDVWLAIPKVPTFLRNDLTVTVTIETGRRPDALAVPNDALFNERGSEASVWRIRDGVAEEVAVALGLQGGAMTEVTSGLVQGDWVAMSNELSARQRVRPEREAPSHSRSNTRTRNELPIKF